MKEFNNMHGFHIEMEPGSFNIDNLILICEYIENMLRGLLEIVMYVWDLMHANAIASNKYLVLFYSNCLDELYSFITRWFCNLW